MKGKKAVRTIASYNLTVEQACSPEGLRRLSCITLHDIRLVRKNVPEKYGDDIKYFDVPFDEKSRDKIASVVRKIASMVLYDVDD